MESRIRVFAEAEELTGRPVNCQAAAAAFYVSLCRTGKLEEAMSSRESFLRHHGR